MPLNNSDLLPATINILREAPYDIQVNLYDKNCNGCPFVRVEAYHESNHQNGHKIFVGVDAINNAIDYAIDNGSQLKRQCSYPDDILQRNGNNIYLSLIEIISNTCEFWNEDKIKSMIPEEIEFIEVRDEGELIVGIPEGRLI